MISSRASRCVLLLLLTASASCSRSGSDFAREGDELYAQGRFREAAAAYTSALDRDPKVSGALQDKLRDSYIKSGDLIRAADLAPDDIDLQVSAAARMLDAARFPDVEERMAAVLRVQPDNVLAMVHQASAIARMSNPRWMLSQMADVVGEPARFAARCDQLRPRVSAADDERAEALFRTALGRNPLNPTVLVSLSSFLWLTGRLDEAANLLRASVEQAPSDDVTNFAVAAYELRTNRELDALPYLERAAAPVSGWSSRSARFALVDYRLSVNPASDERPLLMSMLEHDDEQGEASLRLARLDYRDGKPAEAVHRLDALLARVPNKPAALLLKARIIHGMGNPDTRYARAAAAADPMSSQAKMFLGEILASNGDVDAALEQYLQAVKLEPDSVDANLTLARTQLALRRPAEAALRARDALRVKPDSKEAALLLVTALAAQGDAAAAEQSLARLFPRLDDDPDVAVQAGIIAAARGNDAAARGHFLHALDRMPESVPALSGLVKMESKARISADTQRRVDAAVAAHPSDPAVLFLAAQVADANGNTAAAHEWLVRAFALDSSDSATGEALARSWERQGRVDEAIVVLKRVVGSNSASTEVRTRLAMLLEQSGQAADATKMYEQIVADDPNAATASYRLAAIYLTDPDKLTAAQDLATAAKRVSPDEPAINDVLGRVYTAKGLTSMAIPPLRQAVAAEPDNAAYHLHLGIAFEEAGNLGSAREQYTRALEIDPSVPGAERARRFTQRR